MKSPMPEVDAYLAELGAPERAALERVREIVKRVVPDAQETISYGMPAFKYQGKPLLYYAAFTHHMSLFPTVRPLKALKDQLAEFTVTKGTIHFTVEKPLPESIITAILQSRVGDIEGGI